VNAIGVGLVLPVRDADIGRTPRQRWQVSRLAAASCENDDASCIYLSDRAYVYLPPTCVSIAHVGRAFKYLTVTAVNTAHERHTLQCAHHGNHCQQQLFCTRRALLTSPPHMRCRALRRQQRAVATATPPPQGECQYSSCVRHPTAAVLARESK